VAKKNVKKIPVVAGTDKALNIEYIYANHTSPAEGQGPLSPFIAQGWSIKGKLAEDGYFDAAPGYGAELNHGDVADVLVIAGRTVVIPTGWLWREQYYADVPRYEFPTT